MLYECAWQNQWGLNYETGRDEVVTYDNLFYQEASQGLQVRLLHSTFESPYIYVAEASSLLPYRHSSRHLL